MPLNRIEGEAGQHIYALSNLVVPNLYPGRALNREPGVGGTGVDLGAFGAVFRTLPPRGSKYCDQNRSTAPHASFEDGLHTIMKGSSSLGCVSLDGERFCRWFPEATYPWLL